MGRFFIFPGIVLIFVAVGLMIAVFSVEDIPFVQDILVEQYCEPGESITHASRLSFSGTQNSTSVWFCDDNEGSQREITDKIGFTAVVLFLVPFLSGMFMIFFGAWRAQSSFTKKVMSNLGVDNTDDMQIYSMKGASDIKLANANISPEQRAQVNQVLQSVSSAFGTPASSSSLADRLKQLEDARNQGLISREEYDRTRQAILDGMDDNL